MFFKFTVKATHDVFPPDKHEEYVAAYDYDHAVNTMRARLNATGWTVNELSGIRIFIDDLRDSCDHTTD